jgi:hypothetical protein
VESTVVTDKGARYFAGHRRIPIGSLCVGAIWHPWYRLERFEELDGLDREREERKLT